MTTTPGSRRSFRPPADAKDDDASLRRLLGEKEAADAAPPEAPEPAAPTPPPPPAIPVSAVRSGPEPKVSLTVRASQEASDKMDKVAVALDWSKNKALGKLVDHFADVVYEILEREGPVGVLALFANVKHSA